MGQEIVQVDAFADRPFAGNPAAVCVLESPRPDAWMQDVAAEMNLAETAFLQKRGDGSYDLRWFTPVFEVDLCGHATLASAHALWESGALPAHETARFHTRSGLLTAQKTGDWITLDFPAEPASEVAPPAGLAEALGVALRWVGKNRFDYLIEVDSEATVRALQPDTTALLRIPARGFMVTALADTPEFDFVSRFFGPEVGIVEDPVTGSAHCCLGPFWQARTGKSELTAFQASKRGGVVRVQVWGERVLLGGQAVTILRGTLCSV